MYHSRLGKVYSQSSPILWKFYFHQETIKSADCKSACKPRKEIKCSFGKVKPKEDKFSCNEKSLAKIKKSQKAILKRPCGPSETDDDKPYDEYPEPVEFRRKKCSDPTQSSNKIPTKRRECISCSFKMHPRKYPLPECYKGKTISPNPCCPVGPKSKAIGIIYRAASLLLVLMTVYMSYNLFAEHSKIPKQSCREYEYMRRRTKRFPWGDGDKSLFHNDESNNLPHECGPLPATCYFEESGAQKKCD